MPLLSVKVSAEEKGVLVREAFELSVAEGSVVSVSEVVRRRLFPVGHPVVEPAAPAEVRVAEAREAVVERVAAEVVEKVRAQHRGVAPKPGHVHRAKAAGPVAVCECGAVRGVDGSWPGES